MQFILSEHAGFCPGVRNADKTVTRLIDSSDGRRIFTLGHLIHNRLYNLDLETKGVHSIEIDEVENEFLSNRDTPMTVVIRTHGITVDVENRLKALQEKYPLLSIVDATCGYVKRIHKIAKENTGDDTFFLLYCNPKHPEEIGRAHV